MKQHRLFIILLFFFVKLVVNQQYDYPIESYQNCTPEQRQAISCGNHANCVIVGGQPGCACIVDPISNLGLTGNPYEGCTYDASGVWQLYVAQAKISGLSKPIISPISNEPFMIRLDRTDAMLRTSYITAALFSVTAMTAFAVGICNKAMLSIDDNYSMIFETAQGYTGNGGRNMILRTPRINTSLTKEKSGTLMNSQDLTGEWRKNDGTKVKIFPAMSPFDKTGFFSNVARRYTAYSFHDDSLAVSAINDVMGIWVDRTENTAANNYGINDPNAYFVQTGFYGILRFGSRRIDIFSMKKGKAVLSLFQLDPSLLPNMMAHQATPVYQSVAYKMSADVKELQNRMAAAPGNANNGLLPSSSSLSPSIPSYQSSSLTSLFLQDPADEIDNESDVNAIPTKPLIVANPLVNANTFISRVQSLNSTQSVFDLI